MQYMPEDETLAYLFQSSGDWNVCAADGAVFRVLGFLGRSDQGISLEELLNKIGLGQQLQAQYSKKFREKYTRTGEIDSVQRNG